MAVSSSSPAPPQSLLFDVVVVVLFASFAIALAKAPRGEDFPLVAIATVMIVAAVSALRNVPLGIIGCAAPLTRHLGLALGAISGSEPNAADAPAQVRSSPLTEAVLATLALFLAFKIGIFSRQMDMEFTLPTGAIGFLRQHQLSGNILCKFSWDDYVLYHCSPDSHVFLDTRYEMIYPDRIALEYEDFYHDRPDAARILASYPHDYVMLDPAAPANASMASSKSWKLIYRDNQALLYARATSPAAASPELPVLAVAPPSRFP